MLLLSMRYNEQKLAADEPGDLQAKGAYGELKSNLLSLGHALQERDKRVFFLAWMRRNALTLGHRERSRKTTAEWVGRVSVVVDLVS